VNEYPIRAALAGVLLFVVGLAIGGGAFESFRREGERLQGWQRADGQVVQVLHAGGTARPVVGFTASGGDRIQFTATGFSAARSYRIGDTVPVLYPIADPSAARIDSPVLRWARSAYAAVGAVILMGLGAYLAWYARRRAI
jgi:hypothetical protein